MGRHGGKLGVSWAMPTQLPATLRADSDMWPRAKQLARDLANAVVETPSRLARVYRQAPAVPAADPMTAASNTMTTGAKGVAGLKVAFRRLTEDAR